MQDLARTVEAAAVCPAAIQVLRCWLDDDRDVTLAQGWPLLSGAEQTRALRFRFARDRERFVRGRGFMRQSLAAITGQSARHMAFSEGPQGKPSLAGVGPSFNLSNSGGWAVLVVSHDGPVGVDLELIDRRVDFRALAQTCFQPQECAVLDMLEGEPLARRFFAFWTAKEARMKLTGEGMSLSPLSIGLSLREGMPVGCHAPRDPVVHLSYIDPGIPAAVCCLARHGDAVATGGARHADA